jgi:acetyl esterase/lipase
MTIVDVPEEALVESRAVNQLVEDFLVQTPSIHTVDVAETRRARAEGRGPLGPIVVVDEGDDRTIAGPAGDIPLRVFVPPTVRAVFLHLHGGGRTFGGAGQQDPLLWRLAQDAEVAVVSVEYRLAPEHPFPAGPDDCEAAARWLVDNSADVFGTSRLLIGGESAGAHLAALTLLRLRDRHGITGAFEAANLVFGAFDLGMTPSQRRWGDRNLVLSTPIMAWFYECFTPGLESEERRDPEISPLWADLSGMPPALFTVGTLDPLLDDSLFMASRWAAAGNRADLRVYPESIHGFVAFPTKLGQLALDSQLDFVKSVVASS